MQIGSQIFKLGNTNTVLDLFLCLFGDKHVLIFAHYESNVCLSNKFLLLFKWPNYFVAYYYLILLSIYENAIFFLFVILILLKVFFWLLFVNALKTLMTF